MAGGTMNEAKKRLVTLIRCSDTSQLGTTETLSHVFGDWRLGIEKIYGPKTGPKLPVVTVRVSPARIIPTHYGRLWRGLESGDVGAYSFTAHVFHEPCTTSGEEKYKNAHDLADTIMQYLGTRDWNLASGCGGCCNHESYPIADVFDMQARESEPSRGARKVCRVIIEGTMLVKRTD